MRKTLFAVAFSATLLAGCAAITAVKTGKPLDPAQVQQDLATANYFLQAAGCVTAQEGAAAAPVLSIAGDADGNQVLAVVNATGAAVCKITVPAPVLPAPAPANAPAVTAAAAP